ncbi:phosphoribosylaminoimidazolesuccinocarboxamide synthase [bacterium]|nr:phosphoribosylaminoimidazolesuccinocarboxamide synthase [bacterium]NUN46197.1 phosphoribosylaminoimidazolesuccinocarboxamide synthase [bacterium]
MKSSAPVQQTDFKNLKLMRRGKVRDVYDLGDKLLIVVTDRISAFDVIMKDPIPQKGVVLNTMASFWFDQTRHIIRNHVITTDVEKYPEPCKTYRDALQGRSMLVEKAKSLPVECIVRGYISGSGWNEYQRTGTVCGVVLPQGLKESDKLPEPIFTPTTKAEQGHDQNITFDEMCKTIGKDVAEQVRATSIKIYQFAQTLAASKGIIIADTKMEFGIKDGELILIDELLSPDSSRFWPADQYKPGDKQPSYDKQFLRDYLLAIKWDNNTAAPILPEDIIKKTGEKYREALRLITGINL